MGNDLLRFWFPVGVAILSLLINFSQWISYRRIKNKITIWAKDAKGMVSSVVGVQKNIKSKKIASLDSVMSNLETINNFANSMFISLEEEMGRTKREITAKPKKSNNRRDSKNENKGKK